MIEFQRNRQDRSRARRHEDDNEDRFKSRKNRANLPRESENTENLGRQANLRVNNYDARGTTHELNYWPCADNVSRAQ